MATPSGSKASISSGDPARKYGTQDPKVRNNITCNFCGKVCKAGISRLKQHLVGGFKDVSDCPKCPSHVREEMKVNMKAKEMSKVENILKSTIQLDDCDLEDDKDCEEVDVSNKGKQHALYDEDDEDDEIEEDIGVLDGEGDGPMFGDNDTIDLDFC
ncbi:hypothetical protein E3N88_18089 [Mikania micrantha]|uniref:BED-type domain-containing protein n=1 Tax=Mikania micrantha TaxID=192012 RepID=A0A5N6NVH3_9ASTR|nr:hypothetical protein E3N88_18089 [Mikania micrantha]